MNDLLDIRRAAAYCGNLPLTYFRNQIKLGTGPAFIKVSSKRVFFRTGDLETWMRTWEHHTPSQHKD